MGTVNKAAQQCRVHGNSSGNDGICKTALSSDSDRNRKMKKLYKK